MIKIYHIVPGLPLKLYTDFSNRGLGALLVQVDEQGRERLCVAISRSLNDAERHYSSYEGEMLAVCWAVKILRPYLHGVPFVLVTDHQPLTYLCTHQELRGKHARWALSLQDYEFQIVHRPGVVQPADYLSRHPQLSDEDRTGARLDDAPPSAKALTTSSVYNAPLDYRRAKRDWWIMHAVFDAFSGCWDLASGDYILAGHMGMLHDKANMILTAVTPKERERTRQLREYAAASVASHAAVHGTPAPASPSQPWQGYGPPDDNGVSPTIKLDTRSVAASLFTATCQEGIVVCELFGGMCSGLEACLRNGMRVRQYIYCDTDTVAQKVAVHRMLQMRAMYPSLLPAAAIDSAFCLLPMDVTAITASDLIAAGAQQFYQWFVIAGWPCQDLSPAGTQLGLRGTRSGTFHALLQVLGALQQLQTSRPPAYLLENAAVSHNWRNTHISTHDANLLNAAAGHCITVDAAQFGSYAHRLRSYWTNIADTGQFMSILRCVQRPPNRLVVDILDAPRVPQVVRRDDEPPFYLCNRVGQPMQCLPTLVATLGSYAFRNGGPGLVHDGDLAAGQGNWVEPNPDERERAMGYDTGTTAAPGVTYNDRHRITGRAMDAFALQNILALACAMSEADVTPRRSYVAPGARLGGESRVNANYTARVPESTLDPTLLAEAAEAVDASVAECGGDIHADLATMRYLRTKQHNSSSSPTEQRRIVKRARNYVWANDQLWRVMPDGTRRLCPLPEARQDLIRQAHIQLGHYGERRTLALLTLTYWWAGMNAEVAAVCRACTECGRRNTAFGTEPPVLNSLPILGVMYRLGVDLAGPLPVSVRGYLYVMIVIDHFTKFVTAIPLRDKQAVTTAEAFRQYIVGIYGAPAEVLTDQGTEFRDEFQQLLTELYVDHRTTTAYHPQANGLAERAVQTVKRALAKVAHATPEAWDQHLPFVVLGYNASVQQAHGFSPYHLMHAVPAPLPSSIRERFDEHLNFDDPVWAAQSLFVRSLALQQDLPVAGANLLSAQHRDQVRYAQTRAGGYTTAIQRMQPGSYVYVKVQDRQGLELPAHPEILRVVEVKDSGVLKLQGRDGTYLDAHVAACTPCHAVIKDENVYHTMARPARDAACQVCNMANEEARMLLCDACGTGWHMHCLKPALPRVPDGTWVCPACVVVGVNPADVVVRERPSVTVVDSKGLIRKQRGVHTQYEGAKVEKEFGGKLYEGTVSYIGHFGSTAVFNIRYVDGDEEEMKMPQLQQLISETKKRAAKAQSKDKGARVRAHCVSQQDWRVDG
jgi:transposase InsO family protein